MHLDDFLEIPECAVIALYDSSSVYVFQSKEGLTSIARLVKKLRFKSHPCSKLQDSFDKGSLCMDVHEFPDDCPISFLKGQYSSILARYRNAGYSDMRDGYSPGKYKLRVEPGEQFGFSLRDNSKLLVYVTAMSARRDREVLGVFESMEEANAWADSLYPDRSNIIPQRHNGDLTKLYYESRHTTRVSK